MADESPLPVVEAAVEPVAAATDAGVVEAPAAAPEPAETPPAEVIEVPAAEVAEPAPVEEPADKVEPAIEPAAEPQAAAPEVAAPVYEAFKLPEGFAAAPEQIEAFTGTIGKYGLTQEAGQELMDLHAATLRGAVEQMEQRQADTFADTRRGWREDFFKRSGNRADTLANDAKWAVGELVKDTKDRAEIYSVLNFTGAGDHPALINLLARAAKRLREPSAPATGLPVTAKSGRPEDRRYTKT